MSVLENAQGVVSEAIEVVGQETATAYLDYQAWVTNTLTELGHENPSKWEQYLDTITMVERDELSTAFMKRMAVNRALRNLLGGLEINTFDIRMMILDDVGDEEWMQIMKDGVLKFIADNNY